MKDYTKEIGFWKRLESFVSDVQTGCCAGEEEKEMIMHVCKLKILDLQNVSGSLTTVNTTKIIKEQYDFEGLIDIVECCKIGPITDENYCPNCGNKILRQ